MQAISVGNVKMGPGNPLVLIAGPCVLEEEAEALETARRLADMTSGLGIPFIFKASYEKDNRGSEKSYLGPEVDKGLEILARVKGEVGVPVLSDVHRMEDVDKAATVLDMLQIPAYLCQQTSLVLKAGAAGKPVNVKKGQFLAPETMSSAVGKLLSTGNNQILLTERGSCFGYNRLVSDIRSIPIMQALGFPVAYDATHIVRIYGVPSADPKGGEPQYVSHLTYAGVAAGCDVLFLETHPEPARAKCDAASMVKLADMPPLLRRAKAIADLVRSEQFA